MSGSTAKAVRRDLRRTVGKDAVGVLEEAHTNIERLANSVALAHRRLDALVAGVQRLTARVEQITRVW
jgi:hypothetical protein